MIDVRAIAAALGGQVVGAGKILCPGPGHSRSDRSLAVKLDSRAPDGFMCFSHCRDDWKECRDYVRQRLGLPEWQPGDERQRSIPAHRVAAWDFAAVEAEANDVPAAFTDEELTRIANAQRIYHEGCDSRGTLAETYLREHRKLDLPDALAGVLRFHPRCPWRDENTGQTIFIPALIAPFRAIDADSDDEITGIHRIALNPDSSKIDRRMLGIVHRAAVKLDPLAGDTLVIGEGVETCMAVHELMSMKLINAAPVWALGSAGAISFFPLIDTVKKLIILGENNDDNTNARAIDLCRTRWRKAGRHVHVIKPSPQHDDMNDALVATKAQTQAAEVS
jgi:hypothetical protein